jgi:hypothetical protein
MLVQDSQALPTLVVGGKGLFGVNALVKFAQNLLMPGKVDEKIEFRWWSRAT